MSQGKKMNLWPVTCVTSSVWHLCHEHTQCSPQNLTTTMGAERILHASSSCQKCGQVNIKFQMLEWISRAPPHPAKSEGCTVALMWSWHSPKPSGGCFETCLDGNLVHMFNFSSCNEEFMEVIVTLQHAFDKPRHVNNGWDNWRANQNFPPWENSGCLCELACR